MKINLLRLLLNGVAVICIHYISWAQFPPPAGQPGSTAIFKDSSIIVNWAKSCSVIRGYINIADTNKEYGGSNKANFGVETDALGIADDHVISLGDGGVATLSFNPPVKNGTGFDFAVFENGMGDNFLELAFVEVSSDSLRFVRFPSVSLTREDAQIPTFGFLDATKINNLAGKYRVFYGTPFDLEEIRDSSGIDIMNITHIRIQDVVGCVDDTLIKYVNFDSQGHRINDPWPTEFHTGGFDLDAVGVMHEVSQTLDAKENLPVEVFPVPALDKIHVKVPADHPAIFQMISLFGIVMIDNITVAESAMIDLTGIDRGLYIGKFIFPDGSVVSRKIVKQ